MHIVDKKRYLALDFVDNSDNESRISYINDPNEFVGVWAAHTRVSPVLDLSRFDAAPLIAFTATKETDYGTETDGRIPS